MTPNFGGSYFNDVGFQGQNAPQVMQTNEQAVLYVFSPVQRQFEDVHMRPFQYGFDDNFLSLAQDVSDMNNQGTDTAAARIRDLMTRNNLNDYMMPSQQPLMTFHASQLAGYYRFILLLTEDKAGSIVTGNTLLHTNPNSQLRRIYTGYFTDEPYNPWTLSENRHSLNKNAQMVITHKTVVGTHIHHTRHGPQTNLNTSVSEEVFQPQVAQSLTTWNNPHNEAIHITTPENTVQSLEENEHHQVISMPGEGNVLKEDGAQVTTDYLNQPEHHVGHILRGIVSYQQDMVSLNRLATRRMEHAFDDDFTDQMTKRTRLAEKFALQRSMKLGEFDLDVNRVYSAQDIDNMVGNRLRVIPFNHERPTFYETANQDEASIVNMYSHLIATVIGPIISMTGLNSIAFEYSVQSRAGRIEDGFQMHSAEPLLPVPQDDWVNMVRAVQGELINGVFSAIFQSKGDFNVVVKADCTGNTVVRLNLIALGIRSYEDFVWHSSLGGMVSPLLGDTATNYSNTHNMEGLIGRVTGMQGFDTANSDLDFRNLAGVHVSGQKSGDPFPQPRLNYMGDREDHEVEVY